jgi:Domain of unknown function (DUF4352)
MYGQNAPTYMPPQYPPQPGMYPPPQPPKKSRKGLWITLAVIGAVLVFSCIGVSIAITNATKSATSSVATAVATFTVDTSSSSSSSSSGDQISKVGGTITLSGVQATLVSAKTNPGGQYDTPKSGDEYVVAHVKLHNTSDQEQQYNEFDFHVKSGTGNITNGTFVTFENSSDQLSSGTLSAGGTADGDLVFEVKKGDHAAELTWQPSFFGGQGSNGWKLGL